MDGFRTTGIVLAPRECVREVTPRERIEKLVTQPEGKEICAQLKQLRAEIAKKNGIPLEQEPCYNEGWCAGTCSACDEEIRYINKALNLDTPKLLDSTKEETLTGKIMRISRMRKDTDGPGISTLVAMHGCPLYCRLCINRTCRSSATFTVKYTPEDLIDAISIDELYFRETGGGVVFGGGEPLLQAEYIAEVCKLIVGKYNIRIETSLNVPWEKIEVLLPYIDLWMVDVKDVNPEIYKRYTGADNTIVLENLEKLAKAVDKKKVIVRVPRIPDSNTRMDVLRSAWYVKRLGLKTDIFTYTSRIW